ncbi:MAG TPA: 2-succinyl-5-enolpyruvyl-6-hydroxy-3-cyclohexene-1-carboxylic-acid synthase [Acidimicrobiales bacterium]|nr:2-succinyl-5-enolpyruvyl-6-hydroxy-3-cyclohexene-1-carboxylic-acid synthase [Acidimicrobiales bacterium]
MSVQATFSATLVDEWARLGVTDAVVCPGSRSTPLTVALAARLRTHVRLDERSAAFFAVGLARATGRPVVVCVTSGTAAAELHPAVVEAHHARVPLIVCTADRPPELHHTGAPQTIEQVGLYAAAVRWEHSPGVPGEEGRTTWRPLAVRAFAEALHGAPGPGPVHLNLEFREPLTGGPGALPPTPAPSVVVTSDGGPADETAASPSFSPPPLRGRGLLVVGATDPEPVDPKAVLALGEHLGWPVLADPLSGCRVTGTIGAADTIVRTRPPAPDCVVLLGTPWLSRALGDYVAEAAAGGARVIVVDPFGQWADPLRVATEFHRSAFGAWVAAARRASPAPACEPAWLAGWRAREDRAQGAIAGVLGDELSEPLVARTLSRWAARDGATLVTSASMPIRDLEWYAAPEAEPPRVYANRGANGIDGVVSTALGVAAAGGPAERGGEQGRTVCLLGDLAFLHDVSGLVNLPAVPCTFVVVDNGGGGIFSFLPQARELAGPTFETLFGTPPTSDVASVARGFGLPVSEAATPAEFEAAWEATAPPGVPGPALIRVQVPGRARNVAVHDEINEAVRQALA